MSVAARHAFSVSEKDYLDEEETSDLRREFLNGVVYGMAGGTREHAIIARNTFAALHTSLKGKRCQAYPEGMRLRVERGDDLRFYYPDAMVVCQKSASAVWEDTPSVLIEVLSDSTDRTDLGEKRGAYFGIASLHTYLVIDSRWMEVTVFRRGAEAWLSTIHHSPEERISLPEVECELTLAEIYKGALSPT